MNSKTITAAVKNFVAMNFAGVTAQHGYTNNGQCTVFFDGVTAPFAAMYAAADLVRSSGRKTFKVKSPRKTSTSWVIDTGAIRVAFSFDATDDECLSYMLGNG